MSAPALYDLRAPAKINWFLHILGRRDDGRHRLQSVMQLIDLSDRLHIEVTESPSIERVGAPELGAEDLCVRAALLLQAAAGVSRGCRITLEKRIPTGAGLGGGSSDAALVLMALNRLWSVAWPLQSLMQLGLQLGADVPFFIYGRSAWAEGIGERLQPTQIEPCRLLIVKPEQSVSTAAAYGHPALRRDHEPLAARAHWSLAALAAETVNDMQDVAGVLAPQLHLALELVRAWAQPGRPVRMSGSGSAVFGIVDAQAPLQPLPPLPAGWLACYAATLERHPHADLLPDERQSAALPTTPSRREIEGTL